MPPRNLYFIMVKTGRCENCGRDAGEHSIEGICGPHGVPHLRHRDVPEPCYAGPEQCAFLDLDSPEVRALLRSVRAAEAAS